MTIHTMAVKKCKKTKDGFVWVDLSTEGHIGVSMTLNFPYDAMSESLVGRKVKVEGDWGDICKIVKWENPNE